VAAILPTIAAADLPAAAVVQLNIPILKALERDMCLVSNPRLVRIRSRLEQAATVLAPVFCF
jgi:hypothetical protein